MLAGFPSMSAEDVQAVIAFAAGGEVGEF
ncbi:MAG: hypothetical protein LJE60_14135 [Thiocapsa sp.]|nr:hypothetical protein [Thiocapsa sp.]